MTVSSDNENLLRLKIRFSCTCSCIMIPCFYKKEKKTEEKKIREGNELTLTRFWALKPKNKTFLYWFCTISTAFLIAYSRTYPVPTSSNVFLSRLNKSFLYANIVTYKKKVEYHFKKSPNCYYNNKFIGKSNKLIS